ncbi:MAG: cytochrome c oxidase subunit 3 [Candidatus Dormibacteraeota bacterium]|jgi:heme/copper-type cytochrome/quinol oxidase subunit 3|nr:cytochrome c oxidase subunit 3 [Candidatus Dormibacteraeota bacterium]
MAVAGSRVGPNADVEHPGLAIGMMGMYIFLASEVMFFGSLFAMYFYLFGSHPFGWPPQGTIPVDWWPIPTINTFILLSSGITCHFALDAISHGGRLQGRTRLVAAVIMALFLVAMLVTGVLALYTGNPAAPPLAFVAALFALFSILAMLGVGPFARGRATFVALLVATILLGAAFEFGQVYEFLTAKIQLAGLNQFSSAFFTMTGFHGLHVMGGLIFLLLILARVLRGQFDSKHHVGVAAATLYWHFVDVVWIFLFSILYFAVTAV